MPERQKNDTIIIRIRLITVLISACGAQKYSNLRFEYGVILNGSQTKTVCGKPEYGFEYGVILNGSQTIMENKNTMQLFEYGVILNGSQT